MNNQDHNDTFAQFELLLLRIALLVLLFISLARIVWIEVAPLFST